MLWQACGGRHKAGSGEGIALHSDKSPCYPSFALPVELYKRIVLHTTTRPRPVKLTPCKAARPFLPEAERFPVVLLAGVAAPVGAAWAVGGRSW